MSGAPRSSIPRLSDLHMVIETRRIRIRPFRESDVDDIWPVVSDPAFPKMMSWAAHPDRSETTAFIERNAQETRDGTGVTWAIEHQGKVVGCIGLDDIRWHMVAWRVDRAELGYWLAPAFWGKQLMTEAAREVVHWGFHVLGLHKITVGCLEENVGSKRVIEKVGFRLIGRHEDDVWRDGRWWSHLRYELNSPDWFDVSTTMPINKLPQP